MKTLIKISAVGLLLLGIAIVLITVGCSPTIDPNLQAQRDIARFNAEEARAKADGYEGQAMLVEAQGNVHVRTVQAEASARILEMHEMVTADMARLVVIQNAFVDAINNHQAAMRNQTHLLQQQFETMETMQYNTQAAADNSWFTNVIIIGLAVVILGLIGLMVALFARVERRLATLGSK